jgi:hypothetical protein
MKIAKFAFILGASAVFPLSVVTAAAQLLSPATTPPSNMGRWDKFPERQEQQKRFDIKRDLDSSSVARDLPAGFEYKQASLADFADCVIDQAPKQSANLFATAPGSREEGAVIRKFNGLNNCTRGRAFISARTGELRGALAEVALKRDPAKLAALSTRAAVPPVRIIERTIGTRKFVVAYGQCLALAAPAEAVRLIGTDYGSDAEKSALLSIGEPLKACMPEGVAYAINIRDVRNHVADALYRMN